LRALREGKQGGATLVNVPETVLKLRYSRAGMVQTKVHLQHSRNNDGDAEKWLLTAPVRIYLGTTVARRCLMCHQEQYVFCYLGIQEGYEQWLQQQYLEAQQVPGSSTASDSIDTNDDSSCASGVLTASSATPQSSSWNADLTPAYPELSPPKPALSFTADDLSVDFTPKHDGLDACTGTSWSGETGVSQVSS
jgi:hypothetical protein